jgi:hypothetical protein
LVKLHTGLAQNQQQVNFLAVVGCVIVLEEYGVIEAIPTFTLRLPSHPTQIVLIDKLRKNKADFWSALFW